MLALEYADPKDASLARFFAYAHSVEAALTGWRLALWCSAEPAGLGMLRGEEGPIAFGWPMSRVGSTKVATIPMTTFLMHQDLVEPGQRVVLARRELPASVFSLLRTQLGYAPDVPGQIGGWWYDVDEPLPESQPPWRQTAMLLPPDENGLRDGTECLLLVDVNDCAYVLSVPALRTYTFGERLADGEEQRLVRFIDDQREVWRVTQAQPLRPNEVAMRFKRHGAHLFSSESSIGSRVRQDAASVVVRVERCA